MNRLSVNEKNQGLSAVAEALVAQANEILSANDVDVQNAVEAGMKESLIDRLRLTKERIDGMAEGKSFEQSLRIRQYEPDGPNYTPRISGIMHVENGTYNYAMSILKSNNGNPDACNRYTFAYENPVAGEGHFIHTYKCDGNPLPSFEGEPKLIGMMDDMNAFTEMLWNSLNEENKVSLFVRYIDIATGEYKTTIINKNK